MPGEALLWTNLIQGSVNTYAASGNTNTGKIANLLDQQTIRDLANQDIVNIINQAISQYTSNDLVGAKGFMMCSGDAGNRNVSWRLY